jgi:MFS family permease
VLSAAPVPAVWVLIGPAGADAAPVRATGTVGRPWLLSLCHLLFGFGYVVTATFLVAAVRASPAARAEPFVWLLVGLAAIPSVAGWSRVAARVGPRRAYALACVLEAAGVAAGGVWTGVAGALTAAALLGVTFMGITALGFAAAREVVPPSGLGRAFALITVGFGAGQVAGPLIAGVLLARTGGFAAPSLLAAAALVVAALLVISPWARARARP